MDELQAAIVLDKLPHLDALNARRRAISARYTSGLSRLRAQGWCLPDLPDDADVAHLYVLRVPDRDRLRAFLATRGIGTDIHYPVPDHRQPAWRQQLDLPHTDITAGQLLTLPCFPEMTDEEVEAVVAACHAYVEDEI
jgi:dTDP-4-amino-4,6-dideoxygalactose transaminase